MRPAHAPTHRSSWLILWQPIRAASRGVACLLDGRLEVMGGRNKVVMRHFRARSVDHNTAHPRTDLWCLRATHRNTADG